MEDALEVAENTYVDVNIHAAENAKKLSKLTTLPTCCVESADRLSDMREHFEARGVFAPAMIDATIKKLKSFNDKDLAKFLKENPDEVKSLVKEYFHCG